MTIFIMRVSDGTNFNKGAHLTMGKLLRLRRSERIAEGQAGVGYWAVPGNGSKQVSRIFENEARTGDLLGFIQTGGKLIGIAEFVSWSDERIFSSDELGWDRAGGTCGREVIYSNLITTEQSNYYLPSEERRRGGQCSVFKLLSTQMSNGDNLTDIYRYLRQFRNAQVCE
jgi:hypothetical protein